MFKKGDKLKKSFTNTIQNKKSSLYKNFFCSYQFLRKLSKKSFIKNVSLLKVKLHWLYSYCMLAIQFWLSLLLYFIDYHFLNAHYVIHLCDIPHPPFVLYILISFIDGRLIQDSIYQKDLITKMDKKVF